MLKVTYTQSCAKLSLNLETIILLEYLMEELRKQKRYGKTGRLGIGFKRVPSLMPSNLKR